MDRQRRYTDKQSPVDIVTRIREELAKFQRTCSNKQAVRETLREALLSACREAVLRAVNGPNMAPVVDHLKLITNGSEPAAPVIPIEQATKGF